jgi:hypothetical protein
MKRLPKTMKMMTTRGPREIPVIELGPVEVPSNPAPMRAVDHDQPSRWDGHTRRGVSKHLKTWTFPKDVQAVRERVMAYLEEGIPDQRRMVLYNQLDGNLDDRFIPDIALGEEVERPFWAWKKGKADTTRVAICLDSACYWEQTPDVVKSRMVVAAGLAGALEMLGYEVAIAAGQIHAQSGLPRQSKGAVAMLSILKSEDEPLVDSGFAHFSDTGLRRLVSEWTVDAIVGMSHLSNTEWRALFEADLYIYIGPEAGDRGVINTHGIPDGEPLGPSGPDTLRLRVNGMRDVDTMVETLRNFFVEANR